MDLIIFIVTGVILIGSGWYLYFYITNSNKDAYKDDFKSNNNFKDESFQKSKYSGYNDGPSRNTKYSGYDDELPKNIKYSDYNEAKNNLNNNSTTSDDYYENSYGDSLFTEDYGILKFFGSVIFFFLIIWFEYYDEDDDDDTYYSSSYHSHSTYVGGVRSSNIRNSGSSFRGRSYGGGGK